MYVLSRALVNSRVSHHGLLCDLFPDYAGWCGKQKGETHAPDDGFYKIVQHEPIGVCAAVTAWNGSLHFFGFKVAPAVATGNAVIIKPSEKCPLSTLACAYLAEAAGFPPGIIQAVAGKLMTLYRTVNYISHCLRR